MSNIRSRIQFPPKRLSQSKSRQKFEPYRHSSPHKRLTESSENRQKMALHEPIVRIKSLIDNNSQKTKLKLTMDRPESNYRCMTHFSNYFYNNPQQHNEENYLKLMEKIDHQTQFIKQGFSQLNKNVRLPRLCEKQESQANKNIEKYEQNQTKIMQYLEQVNQAQKQNNKLRRLIDEYQQKIKQLENQLFSKNQQCINLLQQISTIKIITMVEQKNPSKKTIIEQAQKLREPQHMELFHNFQVSESKFWQTKQNMDALVAQKDKEIARLKLENEMLSEEIKLLYYTIREEEHKMNEKVKSCCCQSEEKVERKSIQAETENDFISYIGGNKEDSPPIEDEKKENDDKKSRPSVLTKKTKSFIMDSNDFPVQELRRFAHRKSIHAQQIRKGSKNNTEIFPTVDHFEIEQTQLRQSDSLKMKKSQSLIDQSKIAQGKTFLKSKTRESFRRENKAGNDSQDIKLWNFNEKNMSNLQLVRNTIAYKFKGFRYTYEDLQQIFIHKQTSIISQDEVKDILSEFPFLLSDHLIFELARYIFRDCPHVTVNGERQKSISIDKFAKILREMVPSYDLIDQEIQKIAMQRIKQVLLSNERQIMSEADCYAEIAGIIDYNTFITILQQYKLNIVEIDLVISQCCIISSDYQHLNYQLYYQILSGNPAESDSQSSASSASS